MASDAAQRHGTARPTLLDLWREIPAFFDGKSYRQIVQSAGDGRLRDGGSTSAEVRGWLAAIPLDHLRSCVDECLANSFEESPQALQDAVNEIGNRLGFTVTHGRYRGVKGVVGNDGLWQTKDGFSLILEVKTTDAYRINLDTLARYRDSLISAGTLEAHSSSILVAVGRQQTGDLEAQIRGSRHAWDVRLISLEALMRLAEVKERLTDWSTSNKINQLLRPVEYTRLDPIVELLFTTKKDLETAEEVGPPAEVAIVTAPEQALKGGLERARQIAIARIASKLSCILVQKTRTLRESSDGDVRLVCLASQEYEGPGGSKNYWYGFTLAQRDYLSESKKGWLGLACAGSDRVFLIPWNDVQGWLPSLSTTPSSPAGVAQIRHWHLYFNDYTTHVDLARAGGGVLCDLNKFLLQD